MGKLDESESQQQSHVNFPIFIVALWLSAMALYEILSKAFSGSDLSSGHDLMVREFKPRVGLCADSSEPGAASDSVSPSLSAPPLLMLCLSLSQK